MSKQIQKMLREEAVRPTAITWGPSKIRTLPWSSHGYVETFVDVGATVDARGPAFWVRLCVNKLCEIWGSAKDALAWLRSGSLAEEEIRPFVEIHAADFGQDREETKTVNLHRWATAENPKHSSDDNYDVTDCCNQAFVIRERHGGSPRFPMRKDNERVFAALFSHYAVGAVEATKSPFKHFRGSGMVRVSRSDSRVMWSTPDFGDVSTPLIGESWIRDILVPIPQLVEAFAIVMKGARKGSSASILAHERDGLCWISVHGPDLDGAAVAIAEWREPKQPDVKVPAPGRMVA